METLFAIAAGIALAAACGFRVFLPVLAAGVAARAGYLHPTASFAWISSNVALTLFTVAAACEILAYYVPIVDHALDTVASPAAVVAGTFVAAAAFGEVHPALKWTAALIAGGGAAATIQTGTVTTRAISGSTTGTLANPIVSTMELIASTVLSVLAILLPLLALALVLVLLIYVLPRVLRVFRKFLTSPAPPIG